MRRRRVSLCLQELAGFVVVSQVSKWLFVALRANGESICGDDIRAVTLNYALPDDACGSYRLLFQMLDEFEQDLHLHVHLENNILFPKAIELEAKLFAN